MAKEIKASEDDPFIRASEAYQLFTSILNSFAGIFRVQSGYIQTNRVRYVNLGADPTGPSEVGDTAVVGGKLKVCTVAGNPGTYVVVGTQS